MTLIGLTGGIGMGKSACAAVLEERGIPVVDTDQLARDVVAPGEPALARVREAFGDEVIDADGTLRREVVAGIVFADPGKRKELESILHPPIRARWRAQAQHWRAERRAVGVVVIPLLFETDAAGEFDRVLCVACSAASQRERLRERGWSQEEIEKRLAAQWPVQKKMDQAHFVIWSEPSLAVHAAQVNRVLASLAG
jgi:dephospho-CoA kinase